jgi:hypothetical protein
MTAEHPQGDEPLIPMPLSLPALRQAVAAVAPSRLPEFFQEVQDAFTQAGDEDSVFRIRHFHKRWGAAIAIERRPSVAARLHDAERALADPDPAVRDQAVREAAKIVQAVSARSRVAEWRWELVTDNYSTGCHAGSGPSGSRGTDRPRIDDLPRRAGVHRRAAGAAHRPARAVNARLPMSAANAWSSSGELDQLTQAVANSSPAPLVRVRLRATY